MIFESPDVCDEPILLLNHPLVVHAVEIPFFTQSHKSLFCPPGNVRDDINYYVFTNVVLCSQSFTCFIQTHIQGVGESCRYGILSRKWQGMLVIAPCDAQSEKHFISKFY